MIEAAEEDAIAPVDLIGDYLSGIELEPQGIEDKRVRDFQELDCQRQSLVARQAAMTFVKRFGQGKGIRLAPGLLPSCRCRVSSRGHRPS